MTSGTKVLAGGVALLLWVSCAPREQSDVAPQPRAATGSPIPAGISYEKEITSWQQDRVANLRKDGSWLTLVGLYWLHPGANPVGSGRSNTVLLPEGKAPATAGSFLVEGETVRVEARAGSGITSGGKPVTSLELKSDENGDPTELKLGSLTFYLIKRVGKYGIRVKDSETALRVNFQGLDYFPIAPVWRIEARFEPFNPPRKIPIVNVLGMTEDEPSPGQIVFEVDGSEYRLDPILEEGSTDLFVIFRDGTAGKETYGAGRFLYADPPKDGRVILDFNRAYNPPCAFSPFATCPLPPRQNRLPFRIEAGEKVFHGAGHAVPPT
ncbi:MAG: DUF1684 domain-containing protein [Acidobacteriota bacterium]